MIWHIHTQDFIRFLESHGFKRIGQTDRHDIYQSGGDMVSVRRSDTLTQAEADIICDTADLRPPPFDTFFGN